MPEDVASFFFNFLFCNLLLFNNVRQLAPSVEEVGKFSHPKKSSVYSANNCTKKAMNLSEKTGSGGYRMKKLILLINASNNLKIMALKYVKKQYFSYFYSGLEN